jgi:hypothetical protein
LSDDAAAAVCDADPIGQVCIFAIDGQTAALKVTAARPGPQGQATYQTEDGRCFSAQSLLGTCGCLITVCQTSADPCVGPDGEAPNLLDAGRDLFGLRFKTVRGRLLARCPICGREDSFAVTTDRVQRFSCTWCGRGGDLIDLVGYFTWADYDPLTTTRAQYEQIFDILTERLP